MSRIGKESSYSDYDNSYDKNIKDTNTDISHRHTKCDNISSYIWRYLTGTTICDQLLSEYYKCLDKEGQDHHACSRIYWRYEYEYSKKNKK